MKRLALASALLLFAGCSLIPWHPFGTPITAEKKAEARETAAKSEVLSGVQESVHKASAALDLALAGNPRGLPTAKDFVEQARTLIDQVEGAPTIADEAKWQDLVARLASDNLSVRTAAITEHADDTRRLADVSAKLDQMTAAREAAEQKAIAYGAEKERVANFFLRILWIVGGFVALHFLGQLLSWLAHYNPAFAGPASAINALTAPALHSLFHRSQNPSP